jgi:hypothetical protein
MTAPAATVPQSIDGGVHVATRVAVQGGGSSGMPDQPSGVKPPDSAFLAIDNHPPIVIGYNTYLVSDVVATMR